MPSPILVQNYDVAQIWLTQPFLTQRSYRNQTGSSITIPAGRLMGVVLADGSILPQASTSTDGSEMPRFVNYETVTVANGASTTLWVSEKGEVAEDAIVLAVGDDFDTPVRTVSTGGGTIRDLLTANTQIILRTRTQNSGFDNAIS